MALKAFLGRGQAHFIVSADPFKVQKDWAKGHLNIAGLLLQLQPKRPEQAEGSRAGGHCPRERSHSQNDSKMGRAQLCRFDSFTHLRLKWDWLHGLTLEPSIHTRAVHDGHLLAKIPLQMGRKRCFHYKMNVTTQLQFFALSLKGISCIPASAHHLSSPSRAAPQQFIITQSPNYSSVD